MINPIPLWTLVALQIAVSAASLVVEIVAGRMLAPYVGMSLYTWTSIIAVVLAGFSAGHWWGGRLAQLAPERALQRTGWLLIAAALSTALAVSLLARIAGPMLTFIGHPVWGIVAISMAVFFLPSLFAGVPAPVLARIAVQDQDRAGRSLGALFAAGAVGAIAGTLLAGFLFISWLGTAGTLAAVTVCYLVTAAGMFALAGARRWAVPLLAGLAALALAAMALARPGACDVESRYFCIRSVDVATNPENPARMMVLDHLVHGISARDLPRVMFTEYTAMLDALARLRAPRPDFTSFFIGGGTYSVPRAFADWGAGTITVAEIDPAVTAVAARDFWFDPGSARVLDEDARRALASRDDRYDIVIGDAFTDIAVPAHLITREFFRLVQSRLTPQGSYLMNVIDFEDRLHTLGAVTRTLAQVFPVVEVWTNRTPPAPGARMVFVVVAGTTPTPTGSFRAPAPDQTLFAALTDDWVRALLNRDDLILTDDYAPIDRLIGRTD